MGVAKLSVAELLVPRSELLEAVKEISRIRDFHCATSQSAMHDQSILDLSTKFYRLYIEVNDIVQELGLSDRPGPVEAVLKGARVPKRRMLAREWEDLLRKTEEQARPVLEELRKALDEKKSLEKRLADQNGLRETLKLISEMRVDLGALRELKRFTAVFAIAASKDVNEITKALSDLALWDLGLTNAYAAILIAAPVSERERVDRTLRAFDVKPFSLPEDLPQNPEEAYKIVVTSVEELERQLDEKSASLQRLAEKAKLELFTWKELTFSCNWVLQLSRDEGELREVAHLRGYVPTGKVVELEKACRGRWLLFTEELGEHPQNSTGEKSPSLIVNSRFAKPFEEITLLQGPPKYGEADPTPIIAFVFPVFWGMMFGDLGHGLVLFMIGLLLYLRGSPSLRTWGTILGISGATSMVVGVMVGEFFGLEVGEVIPPLGALTILPMVDEAKRTLNFSSINTLLIASILIGIFHMALGLLINIGNALRHRHFGEILLERLPLFILYVVGILFGLAFIGAGNSFDKLMVSDNPVPFLGLPARMLSEISIPIMMVCIGTLILGKPIAVKLGRATAAEGFGMLLFLNIIEVLLGVVPRFLANTVSYARLGIMLAVHVALLLTLNAAWSLGLVALPMIILGNAGIMALEGLIVYIQDIRLHIYEWFTKFFEGSGQLFQPIVPRTSFVDVAWA